MADRVGLYPGTFDPITNGHLDVIRRCAGIVDRLIVAVAADGGKETLFSLDERVDLMRSSVAGLGCADSIVVEAFKGLLMRFAKESKVSMIVRGLRVVSDFEYEFQMAGMNAHLDPDIETIFLMASEGTQFISSRFVKEICRLDGDISKFVPSSVKEALCARFRLSSAALPTCSSEPAATKG